MVVHSLATDYSVDTTMAELPLEPMHQLEQRSTTPLAPPTPRSVTPETPSGSARSINVLLEAAQQQLQHLKLDIPTITDIQTTTSTTTTTTDTTTVTATNTTNLTDAARTPSEVASAPPGHRRSSTLGSAVTDDWTVQSPPVVSGIPTSTNSTSQLDDETPSTSSDKPPILPSMKRAGRLAKRGDSTPVPTIDDLSSVPRRSATTGHSAPRRRRTGARTRGKGSTTTGSGSTSGSASASDDFEVEPSPLASPAALGAHRAALGALRRAERGCRRAQALAAADAAPREQRRAWAAVNTYHREAISAAAHVRLWAAAYEPPASDPDVAQGNAALPPYHAPVLFPTARRARRARALERARAASQHLAQRQERMLHYLQLAASTTPTTPLSLPPQRQRSSSFA